MTPDDRGDPLEEGLRAAYGPAAPGGQSVLSRLAPGRSLRPVVLLRDEGSSPEHVLLLRSADAARTSEGRYQVVGEIARGGVGVVLKGHDVDLGRDVAMKVLREEHAENPDVLQRFVEEAQIGGPAPAPGDRAGLRAGRSRGPAPVLHDEADQGPHARGAARRARRPRARTGAASSRSSSRSARRCLRARARRDPPRPEARQRDGGGVRRGAGRGLGPGQGADAGRRRRRAPREAGGRGRTAHVATVRSEGTGSDSVVGIGDGHAALHAARAGARRRSSSSTSAPTCSRSARSCARS